MRFDDETWERWGTWIDRIREDVQQMVNDQAVFDGFRDVVVANGDWLDELEADVFIDLVKRQYVAATAMAIRRHMKNKDDAISLYRLLHQMREASNQITFEFYLSKWPLEPDGAPWQQATFAILSDDELTISRSKVQADLDALDSLKETIEAMADKTIAHLDKRPFAGEVTFNDLRDSVRKFDELVCKYVTIVRATGYRSLEANLVFDWKRLFRHPWIRPA